MSITDLPSLYAEYIKILLSSNHSCISLLEISLPWSTHILFGLQLDSFTISIKTLRTVFPFLSFKGLTRAYLVKRSMPHNKYLTLLLFVDNGFISVKSVAQILSLNHAYTFLLLNLLITGLCNSSASCSLTLIPDPVFLSKLL